MSTGWLVDKSAIVRLARSPDAETWLERIERGLVQISTATRLEIGYSARSAKDLQSVLASSPVSRMPVAYSTPAAEDRAVEVLIALAARGHHRAPSVPDLLVAGIAEKAELTVLHDDKDFDLIASITGQPVERLTG